MVQQQWWNQPVPGSQIVKCGRTKTSKAKIRRARLGKGGGGGEKNGRESLLAFLQLSSAHFGHVWIRLSKLLTLQLATIILKFLARAFRVTRTPCANLWKFMSSNSLSCESTRFFRLQFLVSPAEATTRNTSAVRRLRIRQRCLRISHSIIQFFCRFYSNNRGR